MVLDTSLLNIQHYKVHIKGKVKQSSIEAIEKETFGSPSTTVANFTYLYKLTFSFVEIFSDLKCWLVCRNSCRVKSGKILFCFNNNFSGKVDM